MYSSIGVLHMSTEKYQGSLPYREDYNKYEVITRLNLQVKGVFFYNFYFWITFTLMHIHSFVRG